MSKSKEQEKSKVEATVSPAANASAAQASSQMGLAESITADAVEKLKVEHAKEIALIEEQATAKALDQLCARLGIDPSELDKNEKNQDSDEELTVVDLGTQVIHINGRDYSGEVVVPYKVAEVLLQNAGNKKMRLLREYIRHDWLIEALASGGYSRKLIGTEQGDQAIISRKA